MVNGCQRELDQSSSRATASVEEVGEACNVRVSQARGRMKGQGPPVLCSLAVDQETTQPDVSVSSGRHFRHLAKAAWEGLWEMVTASGKYPESSGQQTKWSSMRGSNRAIFSQCIQTDSTDPLP